MGKIESTGQKNTPPTQNRLPIFILFVKRIWLKEIWQLFTMRRIAQVIALCNNLVLHVNTQYVTLFSFCNKQMKSLEDSEEKKFVFHSYLSYNKFRLLLSLYRLFFFQFEQTSSRAQITHKASTRMWWKDVE